VDANVCRFFHISTLASLFFSFLRHHYPHTEIDSLCLYFKSYLGIVSIMLKASKHLFELITWVNNSGNWQYVSSQTKQIITSFSFNKIICGSMNYSVPVYMGCSYDWKLLINTDKWSL
jgi:hypothetical protein